MRATTVWKPLWRNPASAGSTSETPVSVSIDALGQKPMAGQVSEIVPALDPASRSSIIKIDLRAPDSSTLFRSGLFGKARFNTGTKQVLTVPVQSVLERGQLTFVYVVDPAKIAHMRLIQTGKRYGDRVEVLSGLSEGDQVILEPLSAVKDGAAVEPGESVMTERLGFAGNLARVFIHSKLTPLFIVASLLLGLGAVLLLPREEEPQIIVPMIDIFVQMPGASAKEVEERVTKPMEKLLWEIPGVEYIYSTSSPGASMTIVRFSVGEDEEKSIVRLNQKMFANFDLIPPGASQPLIKPRSIDDVPILALTLWSERYDHFMLRRVAAQVHDEIKQVPDVSEVKIIGGRQRQVRVALDKARMAAFGIAPAALVPVLQQSNQQLQSGHFSSGNREFLVETGGFVGSAEELGRVVVGVFNDRPVYLRDVASLVDGPEEPADYVLIGSGKGAGSHQGTGSLTLPSPYPWPSARGPMPSSWRTR